jgi:GDP-L-fucose synthase
VDDFIKSEKPDYLFICAGKVGGIAANRKNPADFLNINLSIQNNLFHAASKYNVKKVIYFASSCTYPKLAEQPIKEASLMTGLLEETSLGYATAKLAGINACRVYNEQFGENRFICLLPNSAYGPGDNFDLENAHVLSSLIRKLHEAKINSQAEITLWGTGSPKREFIYADDIAEAALFAVQNCNKLENTHYNIGSGCEYSISKLAEIVAEITGFKGQIKWDKSKPDGAARKLLDSEKFRTLGWQPKVNLSDGIRKTYQWFKNSINS